MLYGFLDDVFGNEKVFERMTFLIFIVFGVVVEQKITATTRTEKKHQPR